MPWTRPPRAVTWLAHLFDHRPDRQILLLVAVLSLSPFLLESVGLMNLVNAAAHVVPGAPVPETAAAAAATASHNGLAALHLIQHLLILAFVIVTFIVGWLCRRLSLNDEIAAWGFLVCGMGLLHILPDMALGWIPGVNHGVDPHSPAISALSRSAAMLYLAIGLGLLTRRGPPRLARHWVIAGSALAVWLAGAMLSTILGARAGLGGVTGIAARATSLLPLALWGLAAGVAASAPARRERSCLERATMLILVPLGVAQMYLAFASQATGDNHPSIAHGLLGGPA
jgi:hypothetical protein